MHVGASVIWRCRFYFKQEVMKEPSVANAPRDDFATLLEDYVDVVRPEHGELLHGTVIDVRSDGVLVNLGLKREGLVPLSDLERAGKQLDEYSAEEDIEVLVTVQGHGAKHPILSVYQARQHQAWRDAEALMGSGEIFTGTVESCNRGGVVVSYHGLPGFVPASHLVCISRGMSESERIDKLEQAVGQEITMRVIEVDRQRHRLVLSQRAAQRASQEKKKEQLLAELHEGQVLRGTVSSVREFGAFVDLGAADGLVHVSELAWKQVEHPRHAVQPGDEVDVIVIRIDRNRRRIGLSMKQLLPSPWDSVEDWIVPGETVVGHVTRVLHFGAFVDLGNGIEGLLHSTEIPSDGGAEVVPGCELTLRVVSLDTERQRVGLSLRDLADEQKQRDDAEPTLEADAEAALISETPEEADEIEPEDMSNIDETVGQLPD